jgi:hypothetical protein
MIKTTQALLKELDTYRTPATKIERMVKAGELYVVKRGLYETDISCPPAYLSGVIYGPSYLSFEYALSFYDLIPERVEVFTAATLRKNRSKKYSNTFGLYTYRDIPESVFPYGITVSTEREYSWLIATPEKALCDLLYAKQSIDSISDLEGLLFDSLRIEEDDFNELDKEQLLFLSERYKSQNLKYLRRYVEEKK